MNDDNKPFYDQIEKDALKGFAEKVGMQLGTDVNELYPLIKDKGPLLELGAGYGRVVDFLVSKGYSRRIYAIDRSENLLSHIAQSHSPDQVTVLVQDMKSLSVPEAPEVVLWMWSGIMEMSMDESQTVFNSVYQAIKDGGLFVVELPNKEIKVVGNVKANKEVELETQWGTLKAYFPDQEEVLVVAGQAGFELQSRIEYKTASELERLMLVFNK